jgi:hypothetical protein
VTPQSVLLEETFAPYAPIYVVDSVEVVNGGARGLTNGAETNGHHLSKLPPGDIELDEFPKNIGENVVVLDESNLPPDGGFGWVVTLAAALCSMVTIGYQQAYGLFIGYCELSIDSIEVGLGEEENRGRERGLGDEDWRRERTGRITRLYRGRGLIFSVQGSFGSSCTA